MEGLYLEIYNRCLASTLTDCTILATELMDIENLPMHGPVHHFLVPATVLTVYNNLYGNKEQLKAHLEVAYYRGVAVPGANCAYCGACGAGLGIGIAISAILETSPLSTDIWSKTVEISSLCNLEIAKHGGPRCCKRDTFIALLAGTKEIERLTEIKLPASKFVCKYFPQNSQCRGKNCLYFKQ